MKLLSFVCTLTFIHAAIAQDAKDIVKKADERARGNTSFAVITVQTIRPKWSRAMSVKSWTKGNELVMILVTAPVKDKGIVYLKRGKEVWNWIPAIERNIKLPPSMMSQSWMGTDFTNDDLVKEASIVTDYTHTIIGDTVIDKRLCYKIKMLPKASAAVVWGKVILCIEKKDYLMLHAEYFDEDGNLKNTMIAGDIKLLGGRLLPARLEMLPNDKPGFKTVLMYNTLEFEKPIDDNFFAAQNMSKVQ